MNTRSTTRGLGLLTALAAIGTLTAPVAFAVPVSAPPAAKKLPAQPKDDFNGDGYADLAVGVPGGSVGQETAAGYVSVVYGSKSGLNTASKQLLHQGAEGIPGTPRRYEYFGGSLTSADLNRDGYADLVVGVSGELPLPGEDRRGETAVVWGSAKGLARGTDPAARFKDRSALLLAGDFDGDGNPDLASLDQRKAEILFLHGPFDAAAKPARESSLPLPYPYEGDYADSWDLKAGDVNGDSITDIVSLYQWRGDDATSGSSVHLWKGTPSGPAPYQPVADHRGQLFGGHSLDVGDVNNDGRDDIALGLMYRTRSGGEIPTGGKVTYIKGTAEGRIGSRNKVFHLDSPRVAGTPERGSGFGASVAIGDLDGDGYGDIVAGANGTTVDGKKYAGSVITLRGTKNGPTSTGSKQFHQNTKGVPGTAEQDDRFGARTKALDTDGDGRNELAVSSLHEDYATGAVWVFQTDKKGVTPKGSFVYGPKELGLPAEKGLMFGSTYTS
ncbi:FG-GAP repeat protein [Streptomyces amakusaensis]|uniref:FG-GAP-like repeat-containing protein n=1 Tax=Streptomyces amakusaensis TaxID=67271 RepID=A0ABW0AJE5_9ACTN